ncbi:MAG: hydrogenase maturation peptidase HycI [Methanomicrobiaceae archaeon]|nr:hydrogenase maturation peptidase HycI [Methanomicrobiaceae archaeon]
MNILMGIGNTLRKDDGVGIYVAHHIHLPDWTAIDCGTAPENFTSIIHRARPDLLVIVDAADMALEPGAVRIIPKDKITDAGIGTHQLPLNHLITYLRCAAGSILFIGIQPEEIDDGEGIAAAVVEAADRLIRIIEEQRLGEIPVWQP